MGLVGHDAIWELGGVRYEVRPDTPYPGTSPIEREGTLEGTSILTLHP